MPLIECKCTSCGAGLNFDDSRDFLFCQYCGTKMLREQIVNITNNITVADGYQVHDADWYYNNAVALINQERWEDASSITERMFDAFPIDSRIKDLRRWIEVHPIMKKYNNLGFYFELGESWAFIPWYDGKYTNASWNHGYPKKKEDNETGLWTYHGNISFYQKLLGQIRKYLEEETKYPATLKELDWGSYSRTEKMVNEFIEVVKQAEIMHNEKLEAERKAREEEKKARKRDEAIVNLLKAGYHILNVSITVYCLWTFLAMGGETGIPAIILSVIVIGVVGGGLTSITGSFWPVSVVNFLVWLFWLYCIAQG